MDDQFLKLSAVCEKIVDEKYMTIHSRNGSITRTSSEEESTTTLDRDNVQKTIELIVSVNYIKIAENQMIEMTHLR